MERENEMAKYTYFTKSYYGKKGIKNFRKWLKTHPRFRGKIEMDSWPTVKNSRLVRQYAIHIKSEGKKVKGK